MCTPIDEDESPMIVATYPKKEEVLKDKKLCKKILEYRGLYDMRASQINYGDIMTMLGKLTKVTDDSVKLALIATSEK